MDSFMERETELSCPQCGGVNEALDSNHEHSNLTCTMRFVNGAWIPMSELPNEDVV
jgi:hypothetical protein